MPRLLYMLDGGHPWGFRVQGGGEQPLYVSKVSASGKAGSAGLKAGARIRALNGTEADALTLSDTQALLRTVPALTIEVEQHDSDPELPQNPKEDQSVPNHSSDSTPPPPYHRHRRHKTRHSSLTRDPERHHPEDDDSYTQQFHHSLKFSKKASESPQSRGNLPFFRTSSSAASSGRASKLEGSTRDPVNTASPAAPPTNSAFTHTSFSCTTSQSGASSVGAACRRTSDTSAAADHLIYSSSSQEAPRVSHRAASSSDLLDSGLLPEPSRRTPHPPCVSASAPSTPTLHRAHFSRPLAGDTRRKFTRSPPRTNCCFLSSSCHSCLTKETPYHSFRNYQSFPAINLPLVVEKPLLLEEKVVSAVYKLKVPQSLHVELGSVSSLTSTSSDSSFSSASLDFQRSDSNSKSIEETDIKCLVDHIIPTDTIKELEQHCIEISCEPQKNLTELHLLDGDTKKSTEYLNSLTENLFNLSKAKTHRFPVTILETEKFFDLRDEFTLCDLSTDDLSQSSYEYSTSSLSSSVETLVLNPCIRNSSESRSSVTIEAGSDPDSDRSTAASELLPDSSETSESSCTREDDSEFDFLERECQSSDSDNDTVVKSELEEIFRKFGFLSHFDDLHYRDFRSIGRCSTIHEETESDGSCGSLKHSVIVKTKSGMGQYYATAVAPVEETNEKGKIGGLAEKSSEMETPPDENKKAADADLVHEYDVVSFEDLKNDDIVDYKSEQFSKSPRSSPNSTAVSSWRTSQASTNTVESSSTAQDSDDTLGKDMSELSSINSRLSTLNDSTEPGFGTLDHNVVHLKKGEQLKASNLEPLKAVVEGESAPVPFVAESTATVTTVNPSLSPTSRKKPVSTIQDALEDLENIEKTAKDMLLKHESMDSVTWADSVTPTNAAQLKRFDTSTILDCNESKSHAGPSSECGIEILSPSIEIEAEVHDMSSEQLSISSPGISTSLGAEVKNHTGPQERNVDVDQFDNEQLESCESVTVEIVGVDEEISKPSPPPRKKHGNKKKKNQSLEKCSDDKPPLPPSASPVPKIEVKKRWWSRTKETPIFISRESYNEEQVEKELQRLRQSYKENDINDLLDSLESTKIPSDFDEEFFKQLLADLKSDLDPQAAKSSESLNLISEAPQPSSPDASLENISDIKPKPRSRSYSASKNIEKVKERIKELLRRKKKKSSKTGDEKQLPSSTQTSVTDSRPETPSSRPVTPHSRSVTPEGRHSRPNSPDSNKSDDGKKGFSLVGFLKSSPKLLRKKRDEKKRRKSDTMLTSESEAEEKDAIKVSSEQVSLARSDAGGSRSNLKGSKLSLDEGRGVKKEVRFSAEEKHITKSFDEKPPEHSVINVTPMIVDIQVRKQQIITVEETIDGDELQSQSVVNVKRENRAEPAADTFVDEATDKKSADVFLTVDNLSRAEHLLPKLPERVKPPRRKKKQKLTSAETENVAAEPDEDGRASFYSDRSRDSLATESTSTVETEDMPVVREPSPEINLEELLEIDVPPEIPSRPSEYFGKEDDKNTNNMSSFTRSQEMKNGFSEGKSSSEPVRASQPGANAEHPHEIVVGQKKVDLEVSTSTSVGVAETTSGESKLPPVTGKAIDASPIEAGKSGDADSLRDDTISLNAASDITETNSTKEPSPAPFPDMSENAFSFYDNDNPLEEPMTRIVEEEIINAQDSITPSTKEETLTPTSQSLTPSPQAKTLAPTLIQVMASPPAQRTLTPPVEPSTSLAESETGALSSQTEGRMSHDMCETVVTHTHAIYQEAAGVSEAMKQIVPQEDTVITPEPFEPSQTNSYKLNLDTLTSLAETMTHLTSDMELEIHAEEIAADVRSPTSFTDSEVPSKLVHDSSTPDIISRIQINHTQHTSETDYSDILKPIYTSEGKNCENARPSADKEQEGWVFLEKEFSSPVAKPETTSSKNFYGPSVAYSSYKVSSRIQQESKSRDTWIQTSANPVPVPPRQFQQKMPVQVMAELKSFLSESETAPILRKAPEPLPRWDSGIKFNELTKNLPPVPPAPAVEPSRYDTTSALQQLGFNESSLLGEIESILGVGTLANAAPVTKPSISPPKGFAFTEYSKPSPTVSLLHSAQSQPLTASTTTTAKTKWMRTESGGYVKAPSQESLVDETKSSQDSYTFGKSREGSSSISTKETGVTTAQTFTSQTKTFSSASFPIKFIPKSSEFNQPNQFTAQYNSQTQQPPTQPRSSSLTRVSQEVTENRSLGSQATQKRWQDKPSSSLLEGGQSDSLPRPRALGSHESVSGGGGVGNEGIGSVGGDGERGVGGSGHPGFPFNRTPESFSGNKAGSASPSLGRKEYRKVAYDGSTLRRRPSQENVAAPRPEESFAWKDREAEQFKSSLPRSQNPTVTLLQKKRGDSLRNGEGHIPSKRPEYLQEDDSSFYKPSDKLYTIKREYESEDEDSGSNRRFAVLGPRKIEGVGPTTVDGVPVSLKTGVKSEYQGDWYRKMFDSLHKVKDDDFVTVKYKVPRVRYGSSGYMSEPEGYDSDFGLSSRYSTLDRRGRAGFEWDPNDTLSRDGAPFGGADRNVKRYVHQPGRIEDYIPGCSSLSEKELRANPEVEYKLEARDQDPPRGSSNHRYNPARMQMTNALKESGYESDSTLVFRKQSERRPENRNISELYRQIQRGGEVPLEGLRKTAPRKPKDSPYKYDTSEVNIHYKTPVRIEQKEHIPDEELARRQEEHMQRVYEQERRKKYLAEVEDIERRRHTDNFTPLQKSPIPLNRYDDDLVGGRSANKQVARALFGFTAQNKRELSFNKGDIISVRRQIDKNWQEGELRGIVGIFPSNYVEILPAESLKSHVRKPSEGQARARFAFQAQTSMEMSLSKGETVILTRRVDQNWYEGRIGQRRGIFPVSYVDVLVEPGDKALPSATVLYNGVVPGTSSASSTLSGRSGGPQQQQEQPEKATIETRATFNQQLSVNTQQESVPYRALYNYKPQNEDELELKEGDIVMVMEKCDDGWYVGTSRRTSLFGTFPGNYVERVA